jgi:molybdate-binding protein
MKEEVFDWKQQEKAIIFLVKESKKGSDIYLIDLGDDSYHFVISQEPTTDREVKQFIIDSYKEIGAELTNKDIRIIA